MNVSVCVVSHVILLCIRSDDQTPKGVKEKKKKKENATKSRPWCQPVLDSFDEQYGRELGDIWPSAR